MRHNWIGDVELIPENGLYKVDNSGRIVIPSYMRKKFNIKNGDQMEYYTAFADNSWFLCVRLDPEIKDERIAEEIAAMENDNGN